MMRQRQPRVNDKKHLAFIRQLSCIVCGNDIETEAAHIRYADRTAGKRYVGKSEKPDDRWTVPLCGGCHRKQHSYPGGEEHFWKHHAEIDPIRAAMALSFWSGDLEYCEEIVGACRGGAWKI
jgi:5-methylcytosine-specific restriction endonuclease McrA